MSAFAQASPRPYPTGIAVWVSDDDQGKVPLPGTDRAWPADATLATAMRSAAAVGITRVADVTRLDRIGIPTYQAIRPAGTTLSVSQGKGLTDDLAKVSALMESIELWHAENPAVDSFIDTIGGLRSALAYDPCTLQLEENALLHDGLPLEWVMARRLGDGHAVPVPYRMVYLNFADPAGWRPRAFQETSTGLASGNTLVEATLHALYEIVERDAVSRAHRLGMPGTRFDPRALGSAAVEDLLDRFEAAAVTVDVRVLPSPAGLPCVTARIVSDDYPVVCGGHGCHLATEIATTRALTEAAQSRLTYIAGARDDLSRSIYGPLRRMEPPAPDREPAPHPLPPDLGGARSHENLLEDLADVHQRCASAFSDPLLVNLTRPEIGIPVVRVIIPGCERDEGVS